MQQSRSQSNELDGDLSLSHEKILNFVLFACMTYLFEHLTSKNHPRTQSALQITNNTSQTSKLAYV